MGFSGHNAIISQEAFGERERQRHFKELAYIIVETFASLKSNELGSTFKEEFQFKFKSFLFRDLSLCFLKVFN
jgi:hypothetical protein